jgi:8-oxo-dGTP diphosphatase
MLLIDAANVIGSRPTGWWRDRPAAARDFVSRVRQAVADGRLTGPVVLVLEGQAKNGVEAGLADGVEIVHAAGDGDDTIAALAAEGDAPVMLVSADRDLAERVRRSGAQVVGPTWLLDKLAD